MIPDLRVLGDRMYVLNEAYPVLWQHQGRWNKITIPKGFVCDGNSVPWFGRPLIPGDWTLGLEEVLCHDFLYHRKGRLHSGEHMVEIHVGFWTDALEVGDGTRLAWSRRDADRLFANRMRERGVPKWRRRAAYRAVRLAFWHNWDDSPWSYHD